MHHDIGILNISSSAFEHQQPIPEKYTCDGQDINPPLLIEGAPPTTVSFALILDDPDAPSGTYVHWVMWNIDAKTTRIAENSSPGTTGVNSARMSSYMGPCPPSGTHRYFFKVYALNRTLDLPQTATKNDLETALDGHVLAKGELVGRYTRKK